MKNKKNLIFIVLGLVIAFSVAKDLIVQSVISTAISTALRVPASIGSTHVSFLPSTITLNSFKIQNPRGYKDRTMLDMPLIHIQFDLGSVGKSVLRFNEVKLHIKELVVCKNNEGQVNLQSFKKSDSEGEAKPGKPKPLSFQIDKLDLTIDRVIYRDYSVGGDKPKETVYDIGIRNRIFSNVTNPAQITGIIMVEALTRTALSGLADVDLSYFKSSAQDALKQGLGLMGSGGDKLEKTAKNVLNLFK